MRRCGCAGTRNGERATFRQDFSGLGRPSIPRASPRIASEWATIRELSHGGSNRNAECGRFCVHVILALDFGLVCVNSKEPAIMPKSWLRMMTGLGLKAS